MYIKRLIYQNVGPITNNNISFRFSPSGLPIPVVIVGENGTGKSVFLSNITDAFYEIAGIAYNNVLQLDGKGYQYYKAISPDQIRIGASWLAAYMEFEHNAKKIEYVFKSGDLKYKDFVSSQGLKYESELDWQDSVNDKKVKGDKKLIEQIFGNSVVASFSPMRYEKPNWMGDKYFQYQEERSFSFYRQYSGYLFNPISVECNSEKTLTWLFDIIADSRADLEKWENGYTITYPSIHEIDLLRVSRKNAENLMSAILGQEVYFRMGNRSNKGRRLLICDKKGRPIVHSIDSLSTGQLALFNMFSSIVRYADNENINLSISLHEITGIVLIDEVELHLHSKLQREVLPKLISLFPKVQFIITSHSPLFLLGLKEQFGEGNIDVYEMPMAEKILTEDFSEFGKAYQYYSDTQRHRRNVREAIDASFVQGKALIITEGSTDWKLMKAAYHTLLNDDRCKDWLSELEYEFLEYEPVNSDTPGSIKIQMSCTELDAMCQSYCKLDNKRKMIFIADNDHQKTKTDLDGNPFKSWGNGVYSFCLPVPSHRTNPEICIEHLFTDEEITREVTLDDGTKRRIFLGSEFDKTGHLTMNGEYYFCNAMQNQKEREKNSIVDGSDSKKVYKLGDDSGTNYALPKTIFANHILEHKAPFDNVCFDSFIPVFERIRDILSSVDGDN